jgi:predicted metal-binding membrane protein
MNMAWVATLAVLVMAEKLLPRGEWVGRAVGVLLIVLAAARFAA